MMGMPIMLAGKVTTAVKKGIRERTIIYEGSSSPRELLEGIGIQAQAALKGLEGSRHMELKDADMTEEQKRITEDMKGKAKEPAPIADENRKLLGFCNRIWTVPSGLFTWIFTKQQESIWRYTVCQEGDRGIC